MPFSFGSMSVPDHFIALKKQEDGGCYLALLLVFRGEFVRPCSELSTDVGPTSCSLSCASFNHLLFGEAFGSIE